ncbi:MAG: hypothetical protein S0880_28030 [Actinomycetota bacterium]|nr:hypothetical protein [Actinomycetota bacterium]
MADTFLRTVRRLLTGAPAAGARTAGEPRSSNGASSFHLFWDLPGEWDWVAATIEVVEPPTVDRLYFWALQASFVDKGRRGGAGHLGLQWNHRYPHKTAANWGGYRSGGGELDGSESPLPGTLGNRNTRDFLWEPGRAYRLQIGPVGEELAGADEIRGTNGLWAWPGTITDVETGEVTRVRDLHAAGTALSDPMVWSEVFARCDHPAATVRWSDLEAGRPDGRVVRPASVRVNYQTHDKGGCANTNCWVDAQGRLFQRTCNDRRSAAGSRLALPS